jgi:hypothetical protein
MIFITTAATIICARDFATVAAMSEGMVIKEITRMRPTD